jgi:hypothetical protein
MITEHPSNKFWICSACSADTRFDSEHEFGTHLKAQHVAEVSEEDIQAITFACAREASLDIWSCPLCPGESTGNTAFLLKHVADHVESFSLRSIPIPSWQEDITESDVDHGYYVEHPEEYFTSQANDADITDELSDEDDDIEDLLEKKDGKNENEENSTISTSYQYQTHTSKSSLALDPTPITQSLPTPLLVRSPQVVPASLQNTTLTSSIVPQTIIQSASATLGNLPSQPSPTATARSRETPYLNNGWTWSAEYKRWYLQEFMDGSYCFASYVTLTN